VAVAVSFALCLLGAAGARAAPPRIAATIDPQAPLFGDTATYVVVATVDPAVLERAVVTDVVTPFTRVAPVRVTRSVVDGEGRITVTETIACLSAPCIAGKRGAAIVLPHARVAAGGEVAESASVAVRLGSRVSAAEVSATDPSYRHPKGLPSKTLRFSPGAAVVVLVLLGVALLAAGGMALFAPLLRSRTQGRSAGAVDAQERAARLLRESAGRTQSDRRRAAALAARVVAEPSISGDAAVVAWSRPEPGPPDAVVLADRLESSRGGGRASG
jgi:hypothetical protein